MIGGYSLTFGDGLTLAEYRYCHQMMMVPQFNAGPALTKAGYSAAEARSQGSKVLSRTQVKRYLAEKIAEAEEKVGITLEWKMRQLKECVERGLPVDSSLVFPAAVINAIAEMNKMDGSYAPTKNLNWNVNTDIEKEDAEIIDLVKIYKRDY